MGSLFKNVPADPMQENFTFAGWRYWDSDGYGYSIFDFETMAIKEDIYFDSYFRRNNITPMKLARDKL